MADVVQLNVGDMLKLVMCSWDSNCWSAYMAVASGRSIDLGSWLGSTPEPDPKSGCKIESKIRIYSLGSQRLLQDPYTTFLAIAKRRFIKFRRYHRVDRVVGFET